ncbi:hypothetical protein [Micromonospora sp. NPDC047074]|uniref:hypothetical protein n=1 Tax=Micromonospora sp. NPDC047074 TaxID=3154339 RepID=UPI0033FD8C4F
MTERRGPVLGVLATLTYGLLLGATALASSRVRRWSADHSVADAVLVVPLSFFGLLLVPALSWWVAALIAVVAGVVFVPVVVHRRARRARAVRPTDR